jgi:ribosomal protein S18 acetylase RimI-like enzyme
MPSQQTIASIHHYVSIGTTFAAEKRGEILDDEGIATRWANTRLGFFNLIFAKEAVADPIMHKERCAQVRQYLLSKSQPGLFYVREDQLTGISPDDLIEMIAATGLHFSHGVTGMMGDIPPIADSPQSPALRFERITSEDAQNICADINSDAYGLPFELMRHDVGNSSLLTKLSHTYVARRGGEPVSTASVIEIDGYLYLMFVATRPEAQRLGFGDATVRYALKAAQKASGLHRTSLHASDAGFSTYRKMGYQPVTRLLAFTIPQ